MASDLRSALLPRLRATRPRTRVALAVLAVALPLVAWAALRAREDDWPARAVLVIPERTRPLALSPDGRTLLTSGLGGITPWDVAAGRRGPSWESKEGWFAPEGAYSPDARTFAAVIFHHPKLASIELVDAATGRTKATLTTAHPKVYQFGFDADGRTFRASLGDGPALREAVAWDVETGQQTSSRPISAPTGRSHSAISPDGRRLAFVYPGSKAVQLWDLEADRAVAGSLSAPGGVTYGSALAFSADGRILAAGRNDGAVDLWALPAGRHLKTLTAHPRGYESWKIWIAPDGRTLASTAYQVGSTSGLVQTFDDLSRRFLGSNPGVPSELIVVDVAGGRRLVRTTTSMFHSYSADGRSIVTFDPGFRVRVRDVPRPK